MNATRASLLLGTLLGIASTSHADETPLFMFGGCEDVVGSSVCERTGSAPLDIWISASVTEPPVFSLNGRVLNAADVTHTGDGVRYTFHPGDANGTLSLRAGEKLDWTLKLTSPPDDPRWQRAQRAFAERHYDEATQHLDPLLAASDRKLRPLALRMAARIALRSGETERAWALLGAALKSAQASGRVLTAMHSAVALQFSKLNAGEDLAGARAALDAAPPGQAAPALYRYLWPYHYAQVARTAGNLRSQRRHLKNAVDVARRMGWPARQLRADVSLAIIDLDMGRTAEATRVLEHWASQLPAALSDYERAVFDNNRHWTALLALEEGLPVSLSRSALRDAVTLSQQHARPINQINAYLNLAFFNLLHEDPAAARRNLADARALTDTPRRDLAHWALDLEARARALEGDSDGALALYASLADAAEASGLPGTAWRARTRRAAVYAASGRAEDAVRSYASAERALDTKLARIPLTSGRESAVAARRYAMREHLELLVMSGRHDDALALVMREQRRTLQLAHVRARIDQLSPEDRRSWDALMDEYRVARRTLSDDLADGWSLSSEQKSALDRRSRREDARLEDLLDRGLAILNAPDYREDTGATEENVTVAVWRGREGWITLVRRDGVVRATRSTCASDSVRDAAVCVLDDIEPQLRAADDLHLLLDSELAALDWHALPFREGVLLDVGNVHYGAGLTLTQGAMPAPGLALLVADPTGNLRAARAEIDRVGALLDQRTAWKKSLVRGSTAVAPRILEHLEQASLFHYAGHAEFGDADGWDAQLKLASETRLGIGDILALRNVPDVVVLSGCETALNEDVTIPTMGLANAFLASGAGTVIATSRSVDDQSAQEVISEFYEQWLQGSAIDDALRSAQLKVRRSQPDLDWAAFRVMTP